MIPIRQTCTCVLRALPCIVMVLFPGCSKPRSFQQEEKAIGSANVEALTLEIAMVRWGTHVPFGNGGGTGGMLDPAHDVLSLRVLGRIRMPNGTAMEPGSWEEFTHDWLLFEHHWDSRNDPEAIDHWQSAWSSPRLERCEARGGVALAIPPPSGNEPKAWVWVTAKGDKLGAHRRIEAPDCEALRASL